MIQPCSLFHSYIQCIDIVNKCSIHKYLKSIRHVRTTGKVAGKVVLHFYNFCSNFDVQNLNFGHFHIVLSVIMIHCSNCQMGV